MASTGIAPSTLRLQDDHSDQSQLRPGINLVTGPRQSWEALLDEERRAAGRLVLLSPDPPPQGNGHQGVVKRFWFRGLPARGAVSANARSLRSVVTKLASPTAVTAVEGIEVLMFWNPAGDVIEFLRALDAKLARCGSRALLYLRPRLLEPRECEELTSHFQVTLELGVRRRGRVMRSADSALN
jgi:hypothetical protein